MFDWLIKVCLLTEQKRDSLGVMDFKLNVNKRQRLQTLE